MEIIVNAYLINNFNDIENFQIKVNDTNYKINRLKLEEQRLKIIQIFKKLLAAELIKSIKRPKNKNLQKNIDHLVDAKRDIDKSLRKIIEVFCK